MIRLRHHPADTIESLTGRLRTFPKTLAAAFEGNVHLVPDERIARGFCLITIDGELAS